MAVDGRLIPSPPSSHYLHQMVPSCFSFAQKWGAFGIPVSRGGCKGLLLPRLVCFGAAAPFLATAEPCCATSAAGCLCQRDGAETHTTAPRHTTQNYLLWHCWCILRWIRVQGASAAAAGTSHQRPHTLTFLGAFLGALNSPLQHTAFTSLACAAASFSHRLGMIVFVGSRM